MWSYILSYIGNKCMLLVINIFLFVETRKYTYLFAENVDNNCMSRGQADLQEPYNLECENISEEGTNI